MSRNHHPKSPSRFPAWMECHCWESDGNTSQDASIGTDVHNQAQKYIEEGTEPDNKTARWFGETTMALAEGNKVDCEVQFKGVFGSVDGIFGYVDAFFMKDGVRHIVDFKTFSDGTKNYRPQLRGYAALTLGRFGENRNDVVMLHILHGGIWKEEVWESTVGECYDKTAYLLAQVEGNPQPMLCSWCSMCSKCKECPMVANAVQVVQENGVVFSKMSICQKLVVLDAVDKLSKTLRDEAKKMAEANGGVLEMDGIRYEMKPWAGKSKLTDICQLAGDLRKPVMLKMDDKKCEAHEIPLVGIDNEELLAMCELPKTKVIDALKQKNADNKAVKKVDIERFVGKYYEKTEGTRHFVRVR